MIGRYGFWSRDLNITCNLADFLQVQTYHDGVRNSEAILFSVQCVSSISSQNYVKFFKLVKSASYLNGCIMHRYFTQVRNIALEIINKAFSTNRGSPYPLSEVMRLLAFETQEQTMEFCSAHGLNVLNGYVQLSRSEFFQPDYVIPLARSISIIEEKNRSLIGEVVNGGPLPPNLRHLPASSFDEKGRFTLNKIRSSETGSTKERCDVEGKADAIEPLHKQIAPEFHLPDPELIMRTGIDVTNEVIKELALSVSNEVLISATSDELAEEIIEETSMDRWSRSHEDTCRKPEKTTSEDLNMKGLVFISFSKGKSNNKIRLWQGLQREQIVAERERITDEISKDILSCTIEEVLQSEISDLVSTEKRLYEEDQRAEQLDRIARIARDLSQDYSDAAVTTFSEQISREVFEEELRIRDEALAEIERMVHQLQKARFLKIWRKILAKKLRLKDTIETFPAGPAMNDTADQLKEFSSLGKSNRGLSGSAQRIYDRQHDIANAIMQHHRSRYVSSKALWSPFDLPDLIGQHLIDVQGELDHVFWKLMVSLPSSSRSEEFALFSSWFKSKLRRGYIPEQMRRNNLDEGLEVETCSLYSSKCNEGGTVISVCTKVISGTPPSSTGDHLTDKLIRETLKQQGLVRS
ncbi:putative 80 kDa MCM3-associated protein [Apostichopus japonicus]|uniref:Putative 80 kDa MCM3-associated protein n=1 Tax=Stichopus japonicus TaxID=307972 RepID=A0A2G8KTF1_STIJA|nr:putative 80 kDa MCM3-associated protein [Apostichopus japonicus]